MRYQCHSFCREGEGLGLLVYCILRSANRIWSGLNGKPSLLINILDLQGRGDNAITRRFSSGHNGQFQVAPHVPLTSSALTPFLLLPQSLNLKPPTGNNDQGTVAAMVTQHYVMWFVKDKLECWPRGHKAQEHWY